MRGLAILWLDRPARDPSFEAVVSFDEEDGPPIIVRDPSSVQLWLPVVEEIRPQLAKGGQELEVRSDRRERDERLGELLAGNGEARSRRRWFGEPCRCCDLPGQVVARPTRTAVAPLQAIIIASCILRCNACPRLEEWVDLRERWRWHLVDGVLAVACPGLSPGHQYGHHLVGRLRICRLCRCLSCSVVAACFRWNPIGSGVSRQARGPCGAPRTSFISITPTLRSGTLPVAVWHHSTKPTVHSTIMSMKKEERTAQGSAQRESSAIGAQPCIIDRQAPTRRGAKGNRRTLQFRSSAREWRLSSQVTVMVSESAH